MSKEFKKRLITSIVLIVILLNCLFISNVSWLVLLTIVSLICWFEFINLSKKIWKKISVKVLMILISFLFLFFFFYAAYEIKINQGEKGILFILLVCIFSDIGGYVVGKNIGGKKLTKISPNKTVSGSIGSFLFSLFPLGIFLIMNLPVSIFTNLLLIFYCLLISLACQIGDLIISYFKRLAKVKDTGNILPGHGGMLDRIDGIIFVLPFLLIVNYLL